MMMMILDSLAVVVAEVEQSADVHWSNLVMSKCADELMITHLRLDLGEIMEHDEIGDGG